VRLSLSQNGKTLAEVACDGPWILFRLPAGRYHLEALTEGKTASSNAYVPATGQGRIILRFPDLGGEMDAVILEILICRNQCEVICRLMRRIFSGKPSITHLLRTRVDPRQEEAAHRIAWAAVKRRYEKSGDLWIPRA